MAWTPTPISSAPCECECGLWVAPRTRNSCFSVFLNFSFLGEKWETRNEKREIDFLHFLPNFGQISDKFWPFLMIFQSIMMITQVFCGFLSLAFLGVKKLDSLARFWIWYSSFSSQIPSYKGGNFLSFFSRFSREMA